ncbi:hypothetical protein D6851_00600 [Altericroceibacterium spongiae]|uniref:Uncharacterized protein n=2 Tax=Altericroceibacterium spongiae TaxID=2320269 RepID=A0A420ESA4_9SPHN|nr:hypothetical protein D6851_00600 [Altericroceibacterium spongiae]
MVCFIVWTKHQRKLAEMEMQNTAQRAAEYAASNKELEDRVRVLERIVTDKGYDVALQIDALRDQQKVDDAQSASSREKSVN